MAHIIAHRGASAYEPENTLRAFERAIEMGATMLVRREDRLGDFVEWALAVKANYVHPCWEDESPTPHKLLTPALMARVRRRGLGIILWHEERPAELRELVKLDVDGICTDTPDVLSNTLLERQEKNTV